MSRSEMPGPFRQGRRRLVLAAVRVGAGCGLAAAAAAARAAEPARSSVASASPIAVSAFDRLEIDITAEVSYRVSDQRQVVIEAPSHVREHIRIESGSGLLRLYSVGSWSTDRAIRIRIDGPAALEAARIHGAASARLSGLQADVFALEADGSARVALVDGRWRQLIVRLDDSAEAEASGSASELRLEARASSQWQGGRLLADQVQATTRDSAAATVQGRRQIDAHASDASSIRTRGPAVVRRQVEDAASVDSGG